MSIGAFIWYDLATTDPDAAATFYASVVGWQPEAVPDKDYTLFKTGPATMAGMMKLTPNLQAKGVPPHWSGYIEVSDLDAMLAKVEAAGGQRRYGPDDIPDVGRFAVVTDADGAQFYLFKPNRPEQPASPMQPGSIGWRELRAGNGDAAFGFYAGLFGWERGEPIDMGPMGTYQLYSYGGMDRGGIMTAPGGMMPNWLYYVVVDDVGRAAERVRHGGGTVLHGPQEVPGGAWTLSCRDPQGAHFALVSPPSN